MPTTPRDLSRELGISPNALRAWLRRTYPRPPSERGRRWSLSDEQVAVIRLRWGSTPVAPAEAAAPPARAIAPPHPRAPRLVVLAAARRRRRARGTARGRHGAVGVLMLGLAAAAVATAAYTGDSAFHASCDLGSMEPITLGRTSFAAAANGASLGAVPSVHHREPVPLSTLSPWVPATTVAIEDRRFWSHGALDLRAIARAALADASAGRTVQGGSTITEQLVRNLFLGPSRTLGLGGKVKEACLADALAGRWSKEQILEAYLNQIAYGNGAYGIEAAAYTYFDRPASDLSLRQAALLAGLPQAPTAYDPFRHPIAARARRDEVLAALRATGAIGEARYLHATSAPLGLHPGAARYTRVRAPDFFRYASAEAVRRLGGHGLSGGGFRVVTTLSPRLERAATAALASLLPTAGDPAAALVAVDPATGAIRAMATINPGRRPLDFNLAADAHRQAGSAFKTFTLAAAIEQGIPLDSVWNGPPSLTIPDPACENADGPWRVRNYADEAAGTMSLAQAIADSVNTIFAQVVVKVGPANVVDVAHRMGVRSPLRPVCSITLGSQAVTPLEMTDAFATLAARGVHHRPFAVKRIVAADGTVLARTRARADRALAQDDADTMTSVLQHVVLEGTGTAAAIGRPVAGKTGTAEDFRDAWFCGYAPQLATCVWVGYPQGEIPLVGVEGYAALFGGSIPALVWHDFMASALAPLTVRSFVVPPSPLYAVPPPAPPAPAPPTAPTTTVPTTTAPTTTTPTTTGPPG
jgi:penicillin-binding protein 1A